MPRYKRCIVPMCTNTSATTPDKIFISVPKRTWRRKLWFKAARKSYDMITLSVIYCCEDHFDMKRDMEKSTRSGRLQPKLHIVPHRFDCQRYGIYDTAEHSRRSKRLVDIHNTTDNSVDKVKRRSKRLEGLTGAAQNSLYEESESDESDHEVGTGEMNGDVHAALRSEMSVDEDTVTSVQSVECVGSGSSSSSTGDYIIKTEVEEDLLEREELYVDVNAEVGLDPTETQPPGDEQDPLMDTEPPTGEAETLWQQQQSPRDVTPNGMDGVFVCEAGRNILGDSEDAVTGVMSGTWPVALTRSKDKTRLQLESSNDNCKLFPPGVRGVDGTKKTLVYDAEDSNPGVVMMVNQVDDRQEMYVYEPVNTVADADVPTDLVYRTHGFVVDLPSDERNTTGYAQEYWSEDTADSSLVYSTVVDADSLVAVDETKMGNCTYVYKTELDNNAYLSVEPSAEPSERFVYKTEHCGDRLVVTGPSDVGADTRVCDGIADSNLVAVEGSQKPAELFVYECASVASDQVESVPEILTYKTNRNGDDIEADKINTTRNTFACSVKTETFAYETNGEGDNCSAVGDPNQQSESFEYEMNNGIGDDESKETLKNLVCKMESYMIDHQSVEGATVALACDPNSDQGFLRVVDQPENPSGAFRAGDEPADTCAATRGDSILVSDSQALEDTNGNPMGGDDALEMENADTLVILEKEDAELDCVDDTAFPVALWTFSNYEGDCLPDTKPVRRCKEFISRPQCGGKNFTRPSFTRPSFTRPSFTRPSFTRPCFTRPSFTRPNLNLQRDTVWHQRQQQSSLVNKTVPSGPTTCNICGRKLRRKQCLHIL